MVEEHVGKKRRKEVRQAITLKGEMNKTLLHSALILVVGAIVITIVYALMLNNIITPTGIVGRFAPIFIMMIAIFVAAPKASRYWSLRDQYKEHLSRYNISKEDMAALKSQES